jgi:hypothetical protein
MELVWSDYGKGWACVGLPIILEGPWSGLDIGCADLGLD